ncbi:MAG: hypothetical protein ACD_57C00206G0005 [uncultured bacterium]|uniref:OmpR/PhoB-type domain-containing protein n=1 Tax=Candidatus Woesebacteria bacterium RIFCSPHIGHO2_12_FULL_41_24 TaxID=1802510 RepID=A0A1F8AQ37_9BACT|nr:MAG: hypothetical protein ACD_57C00206G0005 [uncultured bacterium]OGM13286.1 MAG: hypothetical protein A2W15_05180 [Candidatus Woesebacteria bacterium RBG_16_41_13]OGM30688.1 MAG: hypothetical protein A2873_01075 [Candidatus Woesebacteria bacterium RIFCSPHIGHO2_01_FULL_42_80]OGM35825.1 MAG: hypothetical protein A3D84_00955 [Candidatus Woesebacteria bacterium RIFCSPHIGHO2_02_FULL_42_20]OGM53883.1 MAG: hypothetical protein A3E44_05720 [Candidatus Woesebacteria bacterium RIFCSPHIGHO2_12_FULL_41
MQIDNRWEYSLETEALRVLHTAHQIAVGFYKVNNFIVLPYDPDYKDQSIVTFPDLAYYKIPRFWEKVRRVDIRNIPVKAPQDLVDDVEKLLAEVVLPEPHYKNIQKVWAMAQGEILAQIAKILPDKKGDIKSITIYPTLFGTNTSFNRPAKFPADAYLYLRHDQEIHAIVEAILTFLTRQEFYDKLDGVWSESEAIVDWLVAFSSIAKVLGKYEKASGYMPTLSQIRYKQRANLTQKSKEFYRKLGVNYQVKDFKLENFSDLTAREKDLLALMIKKGSSLTTVDEVAEILFKENEDAFSLQAIAKQIQRLRDKLEANGVSGSFIQTKRGQGYLLVN